MSRRLRHLAQIVGGPLGSTRAAVVVRALTLAAWRDGATVTILSDRPGGEWEAAPLERLGSLPPTTATIVHLGTPCDPQLRDVELPGRVLTVDHASAHPAAAAAADSWWRSVVPDAAQLALLAAHPGPHVVAVGPLGEPTHSDLAIEATSALVQHLRPDATAALLGSDGQHAAEALHRQVIELGLVACAVTPDAADRIVRAHLARADAYLALGDERDDPALDHARANGVPVVDTRSRRVCDLAAAISVAFDEGRTAPRSAPPVGSGDEWFDDLHLWEEV